MKFPQVVLGIDPGTKCGWALRKKDGEIISGVLDCKPNRHESPGMRWIRLRRGLLDIITAYRSGCEVLVAYEDVRRHLGTDAAHIYGGAIAVIQEICCQLELEHTGIPVATVKKFATGKGNATKEAMAAAAAVWWPGFLFEDDNEVDARWIAEVAFAETSIKR